MNKLSKSKLLEVGITTASEHEVLEFITKRLEKNGEKFYIVTPNPEILVIANNDEDYKMVLNNAEIALPDGIGVVIGARVLGIQIEKRISGVDFVKSLCKHVSDWPITVSFLGGGPNVAEKTAECLRSEIPNLKVGWALQEWTQPLKLQRTDVLFVAFGSPKQEIWIKNHLNDIPARVVIGVGGAFDMISGKVTRAPKFFRDLGLEWLFRLLIQPWRIRRQLSLLTFIYLIVKEKMRTTER
jgi:N-acetylglucosaminyldiphosphoundecaprenol N-acetyl-beta-D-mannosaminyltransferase